MTDTTPKYTALPLSAIPKIERPNVGSRKHDPAEAAALIALMSAPDSTASDGQTFGDRKSAFNAGNAAKRLATTALPDGKRIILRTWQEAGDGSPFRWAIMLGDARPPKVATPAPESTEPAAAAEPAADTAGKGKRA